MNKNRTLILGAAAALFHFAPASAWDCSKWVSLVPGTECYRPLPEGAKATAGAQAAAQAAASARQAQTQSQSATGGAGGAGGSASQSQTAAGGAGGAATQSQDASNAGNSQSTSSYYSSPRQTPPAFSGLVEPTASCTAARNGGASSPVAALSFGFSARDKECEVREDARMLWEMGQQRQAVELLCADARRLGLKDCHFTPPPPPPPVSRAAPAELVTQEQLREAERRIVEKSTSK